MFQIIHITAAYSNAVLVAILPHVSDFAKKLDLPVPQPIPLSQVIGFRQFPYKDEIGGALILSNHYWFAFNWRGYIDSFRSPDNAFFEQDPAANLPKYVGKINMTTNEAIVFAREILRKLGYKPELMHAGGPPTQVEGPYDIDKGHIPFCRIRWESPEATTPEESKQRDVVDIQVNLEKKTIVGMFLLSTNAWRTPLKVNIKPELESDYQKRIGGKMYVRTNAPPHWHPVQTSNIPPVTPPLGGRETKQE